MSDNKEITAVNGAPEILISVSGNEGWHQDSVNIHVEAWDPSQGSGISSLLSFVGELPAAQARSTGDDPGERLSADFIVERASTDGKGVSVLIQAMDYAGNVTTLSRQIYIDRTSPVIEIEHEREITASPSKITVRITDDNIVASKELAVWRTAPDGERKQVLLESGEDIRSDHLFKDDGEYDIHISAADAAGNCSDKSLVITVDKTKPVIRYVRQMEGTYITDFQWNYREEDIISDFTEVTCEMLLDGNKYEQGKAAEEEGCHVFTVRATDAAGNVSVEEAAFIIDRTPPEILISNVRDNETYIGGTELGISVGGKGEKLSNIYINGKKMKLETGTQIFRQHFTEPGEYRMRVEAVDLAENKCRKDVVFYVVQEEACYSVQGILKKGGGPAAFIVILTIIVTIVLIIVRRKCIKT